MDRPLGVQISHMLKDRGATHVFGIPGVHNQELYRGIEEAGLTHILARHEQGAGFMADGYARATGQPGVAYVITGPGLCNIMTPMGQAYSDSVPILVISSCLDETAATRNQLHQMRDQRAAAETVCAWSEEARTAETAYALIRRAMLEFQIDRRRPRHVQIPISLLETVTGPAAICAPDVGRGTLSMADRDRIAEIAARLSGAKYPLMIFGGGAAGAAATGDVVDRVLRATGAAAFMTYAGRGAVRPDHSLGFGSMLARPDSARVLEQSDLLLLLGTDLSETDLWRSTAGHRPGAVVVNIDTEVLADAHPRDTRVRLEVGTFLDALDQHLDGASNARWSARSIAETRARWRAEIDAERPGILPVADALRTCLPDGTMIYSDMTQFAYAALEVWDMDRPGHWHHPTGFGTLGYALPAAIGGAVGRPGKPTCAIAGDYGFQYTVQELATAVELDLPLPILLWDNGKLGEIEDSMARAQIAPNAVIQRNPDFLKLADAYGARAAAPRSLSELQADVRTAFEAGGPTQVRVTPDITAA